MDFAKLYVDQSLAKFTAFYECDASRVFYFVAKVPVFSATAENGTEVRKDRNSWAHCEYDLWNPVRFHYSFVKMRQLVKELSLPSETERDLLDELTLWETQGNFFMFI